MTDFVLDEFLPYQLVVLADRLSRDFSALYRDRFGIGVAEWRVVAHLSQTGAVSVREICDRVDMDKPKVSRAASRLEQAGYVTKRPHPTDGRLVELALSDKGRRMVQDLTPLARAFEEEVLAQLGARAGAFREILVEMLAQPPRRT